MNILNIQIFELENTPCRILIRNWGEVKAVFPALVGLWKFTLLRELKEGRARGV